MNHGTERKWKYKMFCSIKIHIKIIFFLIFLIKLKSLSNFLKKFIDFKKKSFRSKMDFSRSKDYMAFLLIILSLGRRAGKDFIKFD